MSRVRILDLDGSLDGQDALFSLHHAERVPARDWGPQIRLAGTFGTFHKFRQWLAGAMPAQNGEVVFFGSGDFHHVTLALLERIRSPSISWFWTSTRTG